MRTLASSLQLTGVCGGTAKELDGRDKFHVVSISVYALLGSFLLYQSEIMRRVFKSFVGA